MKTLTNTQYTNSMATMIRNCIYYSDSSLDNRVDLFESSNRYITKQLHGKQLSDMKQALIVSARLYLKLKV